ncbi:MAG TPA: hypothetical protein VFT91_00005 [Dehalococcoidia bacterium]|nr:hypothetical protein [Dehalococcoidia bacterium]
MAGLVLLGACGGGGGGGDLPDSMPFAPALEARLHEIRDKVSEVRGLPPFAKVKEGTITQDALLQYSRDQTKDMTEDEKRELASYEAALRLLRLIGPDDDLLKIATEDYVTGILGLYIPTARRLVMIGEGQEIGMNDELTLAHEYTHSLQDGAFDIRDFGERWQKSRTERSGHTQYGETIDCLIEGDAELTQRVYAERVFGSDWEQKLQAEADQEPGNGPTPLPPFLVRAALFNYQECRYFVEGLYRDGGWAAVNAAYDDPPATTEQVMHLDAYRDHELANGQQPDDLSGALGEDWELLDVSQFGEFDVYNYFVTMTGDDINSRIAAAGWGGGWLSVYRDKKQSDQVLADLSLSWDSNDDFDEFLLSYWAVLSARGLQMKAEKDQPEVSWTGDGEYGLMRYNPNTARADILIATDQATLNRVNP